MVSAGFEALCCSLVVVVLVLEIALCSLSLCSVQVVEQGGRGCTHKHLYSGLLSGLRSRGFSFSHRGGFPRKKCLSHLVIAYTISCYRRSIFLTGSHNVRGTRPLHSAAPRARFPQQSGIRASGFRALGLITSGYCCL